MSLSTLPKLDFGSVTQLGPDDTTDGVSIGGAWPGVPGGLDPSDDFLGGGVSGGDGILQGSAKAPNPLDPFNFADPQFLWYPTADDFSVANLETPQTIVHCPDEYNQFIVPRADVDGFMELMKKGFDISDCSYGVIVDNQGRKSVRVNAILRGRPVVIDFYMYSPTKAQPEYVLGYFYRSGCQEASMTFIDMIRYYIGNGADATRPYKLPESGLGLIAPRSKESDGPQTAQNQKPPHGLWVNGILNPLYPNWFNDALALYDWTVCSDSAGLLPWFDQLTAVVLDVKPTEGGAAKRHRDDMPSNPAPKRCTLAALVNAFEDANKKDLLPKYGAKSTKSQFSSKITLAVYRSLPALFQAMLGFVQDYKSDVEGARWMIKCLGTLIKVMESLELPMAGSMYVELAATFEEVADKCEFLRETIDAVLEA
jgi:hypothetical protein